MKRAPTADSVDASIAAVCEAVGGFIEYWGFKAIHGRIWTLLALRHDALSQSDIARHLNVSRALVSAVVADLSRYGLVRATGPGRNAPYEAVMDVWSTISDVLRSREWMLLESARMALLAAREELQQLQREGKPPRYDVDRVLVLLRMTELAQMLLRALMALRAPRGAEALRLWTGRAAAFVQGFRKVW